MDTTTIKITIDELLTEMERLAKSQGDGPAGRSMQEIMKQTGWSRDKVRKLLRNGIDAGTIKMNGCKKVLRIDGWFATVPVYLPVKAAEPFAK